MWNSKFEIVEAGGARWFSLRPGDTSVGGHNMVKTSCTIKAAEGTE